MNKKEFLIHCKDRLELCIQHLSVYLEQIGELERNPQLSDFEKNNELSIIREQIKNISDEIDTIKREITIAQDVNIN